MNFRQLETFRAVMISGSASRAAELLGISQPAVSRAIAELEQRAGFALFDRVKGRLVPTPEGQLFFRDVSASFAGLDSLRAAAARIRDFGSGSVRIATLAAMGQSIVPRAMKSFRERHPQIALTLHIASSATVRDYVVNGQFDIGLAADEVDLTGTTHSVFASFRAVCAIPPAHPLAAQSLVHARDLDRVEFIALAPEDRARSRMFEEFERAEARPQVVVETPNSATVCALALNGVGVGLVNPASAEGFQERGLVLRPFEPAVYFKAHILFRPDAQRARLVRDFTTCLRKALQSGSQRAAPPVTV